MALRRRHQRTKLVACRVFGWGQAGATLAPRHFWTPAPSRSTGQAFAGMANWRAGVSVLRVQGFQVTGAGDCRMRRLHPTQVGDEPLAPRSLRPRYIYPRHPSRVIEPRRRDTAPIRSRHP